MMGASQAVKEYLLVKSTWMDYINKTLVLPVICWLLMFTSYRLAIIVLLSLEQLMKLRLYMAALLAFHYALHSYMLLMCSCYLAMFLNNAHC